MARSRSLCPVLGAALLLPSAQAAPFGFKSVVAEARELGARPFQPAPSPVPKALLDLSYDRYRDITFNNNRSLWKPEGLPFIVQFFMPGWMYKDVVGIYQVDAEGAHAIPFSPDSFYYGPQRPPIPQNLGYAGFRLASPVDSFGEVAVFLGASYFRMIGRGEVYGTSARGVALDTTLATPEEFPRFRTFWIYKPGPGDREITVDALMDSPSLSGAYEFVIRPGPATMVRVRATLFLRREVKRFGVAPLTSMFERGEIEGRAPGDYRPQVHDADGLLLCNGGGEWLWRPLTAVTDTQANAFVDRDPRGFGLMQRDRKFDDYRDLEARYHQRPSVWVVPGGNWGSGVVELIRSPSNDEFADNVNVFWVPAVPPRGGQTLNVSYSIWWMSGDPPVETTGRVVSTRVAKARGASTGLRFILEFGGKALEQAGGRGGIEPQIDCGEGGRVTAPVVQWNEFNQSWRLSFVAEASDRGRPVELRACLRQRGRPITETWTYTLQP